MLAGVCTFSCRSPSSQRQCPVIVTTDLRTLHRLRAYAESNRLTFTPFRNLPHSGASIGDGNRRDAAPHFRGRFAAQLRRVAAPLDPGQSVSRHRSMQSACLAGLAPGSQFLLKGTRGLADDLGDIAFKLCRGIDHLETPKAMLLPAALNEIDGLGDAVCMHPEPSDRTVGSVWTAISLDSEHPHGHDFLLVTRADGRVAGTAVLEQATAIRSGRDCVRSIRELSSWHGSWTGRRTEPTRCCVIGPPGLQGLPRLDDRSAGRDGWR